MDYLRFVITRLDHESQRRQGLFQALSDLEHADALSPDEQALYDNIYAWFRHHLRKPRNLSRSSKPHARNVALSWFKVTAHEHIRRMHGLASILQSHGVDVDIIRSQRPGYIVYEDDHQVAAEPFRDSGA